MSPSNAEFTAYFYEALDNEAVRDEVMRRRNCVDTVLFLFRYEEPRRFVVRTKTREQVEHCDTSERSMLGMVREDVLRVMDTRSPAQGIIVVVNIDEAKEEAHVCFGVVTLSNE